MRSNSSPRLAHDLDGGEPAERDLGERAMEVYGAAFRSLVVAGSTRDLAEDIAQEVVLVFLGRSRTILSDSSWARTVALRMWWRVARSRRVEVRIEDQVETATCSRSRLDARIDLSRALAIAPARDRVLLRLSLSGRSHREISALLGFPVKQVGVRLQRAARRAARRFEVEPQSQIERG